MNLNKLDYPMFKITVTEALLLIEARKHLRAGGGYWYLCSAVTEAANKNDVSCSVLNKLHGKIAKSLDRSTTLFSFFREKGLSISGCGPLRLIWIKKLLAHNGY